MVLRVGSFVLVIALMVGAAMAVAQTSAPAPASPPSAATAPAAGAAPADPMKELGAKLADATIALDTVWVLVAAFLVFFMNLGFAAVESGFCRAKNTVSWQRTSSCSRCRPSPSWWWASA